MLRSKFYVASSAIGLALASSASVFGASVEKGTVQKGEQVHITLTPKEAKTINKAIKDLNCPANATCTLGILISDTDNKVLKGDIFELEELGSGKKRTVEFKNVSFTFDSAPAFGKNFSLKSVTKK
jgi:hypothetical protein